MADRGFTFIEIIITILIIGIIAAIVNVQLNNSVTMAKLEGARWKLKSDLSYAQSLAVTQQVNHGIIFTPPNSYSVYRQTTGNLVNNPLSGGTFTVNYSADSNYRGVTINSTSFGSPTTNRVEFNNFGTPSDGTTVLASDGSVTLGYSGLTATVTVTKNTGKVN
jgi:prepilin-type N-terminal cleavage/methylation domain-containing protein